MPYIAIDTSTSALSVAVGERGKLLGETNTLLSRNHSVTMMPALEGLMSNLEITPDQIKGVIVGRGPGSYTGVRIAVTAAKAFAYALNIPLVGVSTLDGMARHGQMGDALVVPMIDARRKQAYTAMYERQNGEFIKITEDALLTLDTIITKINSRMAVRRLDKKPAQVLLIGDAAHNHQAELTERLGDKARVAPTGHDFPRAAHLLEAGIALIEAGETHDPDTFAPEYLQLVEAEVKWLAAQTAKGGDGQ